MNNPYTPYRKGTVLAPSGPTDHLHIICCDPLYNAEMGCDCVLVINISSIPDVGSYDDACVLQEGDHDFIHHGSYLYYRKSVLWRVPTLSNKVDSGEYRVHADVNDELMRRVIAGFLVSDFTPFKIVRFVEKNLT
ncbi:MAG: hypothetical protein RR987_16560 [Hafnia sp.]